MKHTGKLEEGMFYKVTAGKYKGETVKVIEARTDWSSKVERENGEVGLMANEQLEHYLSDIFSVDADK